MKAPKQNSHTPGPWTVDRYISERGDSYVSIRGTPDRHPTIGAQVCTINQYLDIRLNGANARLIAAAPELLQQLEDAYMVLVQYAEYSEEMRKLGKGFHPNFHGWGHKHFLDNIEFLIRKAKGLEPYNDDAKATGGAQ